MGLYLLSAVVIINTPFFKLKNSVFFPQSVCMCIASSWASLFYQPSYSHVYYSDPAGCCYKREILTETLQNRLCFFFLFLVQQSPVGQSLLIQEVSRSHTTTHHSQQDSSGRVISSSQRPLPDNTQHLQQTDIHAPGGIRTHNLSRRAAKDLRFRRRGQWDRPKQTLVVCKSEGPL